MKQSIEELREKRRLQREVGELRQQLSDVLRVSERLEAERNVLLKVYAPQTFKIKPLKGGDSQATAFIIASDWHIEELVEKETVSGLNEYNLKIARKRAKRFFQSSHRLLQITSRDTRITTVVLALLGDFLSGYIHEELQENNQLAPGRAIWEAQNLLASGIEFLLANTEFNFVLPCHSGNHGRLTEKTRFATEQGNSLEVYMYKNLAAHFAGNPRVKFLIAGGYHSYMDVYGYTVCFHHGHAVKYQGGVGGIYIPINKAIAQWNKARNADLYVQGHYHQFRDGGNFICNGSLIGYNPYALSIKADFEGPKQAFFLINGHGKVAPFGKGIVAPIRVE